MGIKRLAKHLLPYAEQLLLKGSQTHLTADVTCIESVVIDGPSLVYLIFSRLLSWTDPTLNILDAQPTCDEVSLGVMLYLIRLVCSGVRM